jgi:hypothetical protein
MRPGRAGRKLWEKQGGNKEAVGGELDQAHFSRGISPGDLEPPLADVLVIHWIETVITRKLLRHFCCPIRSIRQGLWQECDRLGGANEGTGQLANHQSRGFWGSFFVFSILDREHIARILNQSMLKPASGPEEGPALFTRELNSLQRALHAFVRTGWRTP